MSWFREYVTKRITRSSDWPRVRKKYLKSNGECCVCRSRKKLHVHHIIPFGINHRLELKENNLMTLCARCHLMVGHLCSWNTYNMNVQCDVKLLRFRILTRKRI